MRETLHTRGRRLTRQRRLVLKVLEESKEHLAGEGLYDRAKILDPNISLATVYHTLVVLKEMGLVLTTSGTLGTHFDRGLDHNVPGRAAETPHGR